MKMINLTLLLFELTCCSAEALLAEDKKCERNPVFKVCYLKMTQKQMFGGYSVQDDKIILIQFPTNRRGRLTLKMQSVTL